MSGALTTHPTPVLRLNVRPPPFRSAQPVPLTQRTPTQPGRPQPVPRAPTDPRHPSPEPRGPARATGGHPVRVPDATREMPAAVGTPPLTSPLFLGERRRVCFPASQQLQPRVPGPSPAPLPGAPLRNRRRVPRHVPRASVAAKAPGRALRRHPGQRYPPRPRPSAASGARAARPRSRRLSSDRGPGPGRRRAAGQPRASPRRDAPRHPGPGARALPRSREEAQRWRRPRKCRTPSSWPSGGPVGTRGTARPELAAPHGLRAARAPRRSRGPGSGAGAGTRGPGGGPRPRGTHCSRR